MAEYCYYLFWLKMLRPKRVLLVYREGHFGLIAACKRNHIPVAEFQHGITLDNTVSFTGQYDSRIDPDYFLTFGKYWKGVHFGMTEERTICIGWAYGKYMERQFDNSKRLEDTALVISSPEISDLIIDAIKVLSQWYPSINFHIRLHPCENYNKTQKERLSSISQVEVVDNSNDSATVLPFYKYVLGENSTVLYEALSLGCKVGMLNICGLRPPIDKPGISGSFYVIETHTDFQEFIENSKNTRVSKESFYSKFDNTIFKKFINNNM